MPMKEWIVVVGLGRMNKYINWILFNVWEIWQYFRDNDIENYVWKNKEFSGFSVFNSSGNKELWDRQLFHRT